MSWLNLTPQTIPQQTYPKKSDVQPPKFLLSFRKTLHCFFVIWIGIFHEKIYFKDAQKCVWKKWKWRESDLLGKGLWGGMLQGYGNVVSTLSNDMYVYFNCVIYQGSTQGSNSCPLSRLFPSALATNMWQQLENREIASTKGLSSNEHRQSNIFETIFSRHSLSETILTPPFCVAKGKFAEYFKGNPMLSWAHRHI